MIATSVRDEISRFLGSEPRDYVIPLGGGSLLTDCECWNLPPLKEEDKPVHVRYQEIEARIIRLKDANKNHPRIQPLIKEAEDLIKDAHVTKRFGIPLVTIDELLKLDKWKGIRKEWWELRGRFIEEGVRVFLGTHAANAAWPGEADMLIAMPDRDQFEILRIHETRGNNHPVGTDGIISALKKLNAEYGVAIVSATMDGVEFILERSVEEPDRDRIRRRLRRLCPSAESLTEGIDLGRVALWWD